MADAMQLAVTITGDPKQLEAAVAAAEKAVAGLGAQLERSAGGAGSKALSGLTRGLQGLQQPIKVAHSGLTMLWTTFSGIGGAIESARAVAGVVSGIGSALVGTNAQMETFETQIATLLAQGDGFAKGMERAKDRMAELTEFAAKTPFEMPEIAQAEKVMIGFGLTGERALAMTGKSAGDLRTVVGDIAAGTGVAFDEMAVTLGKFSTGATGEAIARLQELGIVTKEELAGMGVEFDKAGSLVSPVSDAMTAAITVAESKFGGGMENLSMTWSGLVSTLQDTWSFLVADFSQPLFEHAKEGLTAMIDVLNSDRVQAFASSLGELVGSGISSLIEGVSSAAEWLSGLRDVLSGTAEAAGPLSDVLDVLRTLFEVMSGLAGGVDFEVLLGDSGLAGLAPLLDAIAPGMETLGSGMQRMQEAVEPLAVAFQALLAGDWQAFFSGLQEGLGGLVVGFVETRVAMVEMLAGLISTVAEMVPELVASLVGWVEEQAPLFVERLSEMGALVVEWLLGLVATVQEQAPGLITAFTGWVAETIPPLVAGLAELAGTLVNWVFSAVPMIVQAVYGWADAFLGWIFQASQSLLGRMPEIIASVVSWIQTQVPVLIDNLLAWGTAFMVWVADAAGNLGSGLGTILGTVVAFIVNNVPVLLQNIGQWALAIGEFALRAIPAALEALGTFIIEAVGWLISVGLPKLIQAAINLADGLVRGFLDALSGGLKGGGAKVAGAVADVPKEAHRQSVSAWQSFKMGQVANAQGAADAAEQALMGGRQKAALAASGVIDAAADEFRTRAPQLAAAAADAGAQGAAAMSGAMGGGAGGEAAAEGGGAGAGAGGAAVDPAQQAMQQIQSVAGAITSVIDLAEKAFAFRGMPPPEIMDEIFDGLKDIMERGLELASGTDLLAAQLGSAVAQMLQGFVSALTGMVDLAEKLVRFRVPTPENLTALLDLGVAISDIITELTNALGEGDLADSLEGSTIASKVAEMLGKWVETLTGMAEMTGALARARWDIDMGPVAGFIAGIAVFAIELQESLALGRERFTLVISDTGALGEALTPWVDMIKTIAELAGDLIRVRWPGDIEAPLALLSSIGDFAFDAHEQLQRELGPKVLLAMDDTKLLGETLSPWIDVFKGVAEAAEALTGVRFGQVDGGGLTGFLDQLWQMVERFRRTASEQLGPGILVALEDSREIAETLSAWLEPLTKVADVIGAIDVVRRLAQTRSDVTLTALWDFVSQLAVMTARFVETGNNQLQKQLLIALEDSREIAETLGAWLDPLSKIADVAQAFDVVRQLAHTRWDTSLTAAWDLISGIAVMSARFVTTGSEILGAELLGLLQTSRDIAETLGAWLDPLSKVADVAESIDVVRRLAQTRWDTTFADVHDMLAGIGGASAQIVAQVQRWADPGGQLEVSRWVAETFGAWLEIMSQLGEATDSIRRTHSVDDSVLTDMVRMLATIGTASNDIVQAVQRASNPREQLEVSQQVAETFDAWTSTFATIRDATESLRDVRDVPEENLDIALGLMQRIAAKTSTMVAAVLRHADPKPVLEASQKVAETMGAWLSVFSQTAELTHAMVGAEAIDPDELSVVEGLIVSAYGILESASQKLRDMGDLAREGFMQGLMAYAEAAGAAIDLVKSASELDLRDLVPIDPEQADLVAANMGQALRAVQALADEWLPELDGAARRMLERMSAFMETAGKAVSLVSSAASLGEDVFGAEIVQPAALARVESGLQMVVSSIERLAGWWAQGHERLTEAGQEMSAFAEAAGAAVGLIKPAVEAVEALGDPDIASVSMRSLARVQSAIFAILGVVENLSLGYRTAAGELDEVRTSAISGFASSANAAIGAVASTVDLLVKLRDEQGTLHTIGAVAREQIKAGMQTLVDLMLGLAQDYQMGSIASRSALERASEFAGSVSEIAGSVSSIVDTLTKVWEFAFQVSDTGRVEPVVRDFGEHVRTQLQTGVALLTTALSDVMAQIGPDVLAQAKVVGEKIKPVAEGVSAMIEPIAKLMENPLVDTKQRSNFMRRVAARRAEYLAEQLGEGIKRMVRTLAKAMKGVKVPPGMSSGAGALVDAISGLVDIIERAMEMAEIDFSRLEDLVRASEILSGLKLPQMQTAGAGAGAGGGGTLEAALMPGISFPDPIVFPDDPGGPPPRGGGDRPGDPGAGMMAAGDVLAMGGVHIESVEAPISVDGRQIAQGMAENPKVQQKRSNAARRAPAT